jgi:predicted nucleic acid-binding protein
MNAQPLRAVFDCNVYLQAMISNRGAAHACMQLVDDGQVILFASGAILDEIRRLARPCTATGNNDNAPPKRMKDSFRHPSSSLSLSAFSAPPR